MGPSHPLHFTPSTPFTPQPLLMTKVWTYLHAQHAQSQLQVLKTLQALDSRQFCRIVCLHSEAIEKNTIHKVIAAFEYPSPSLRQQIISRRKRGQTPQHFTELQLQGILNICGLFVATAYPHLCSHSDLFSNIVRLGGEFKIIHPQLLPCTCDPPCGQLGLQHKLNDIMLELMLLEKVVRGGSREKERAAYLYSHSAWLVDLLEKLSLQETDMLDLSRRSKYFQNSQHSSSENCNSIDKYQSQTSRFSLRPSILPQKDKYIDQTKDSNTRIRYLSHLSHPSDPQQPCTLNDLYLQTGRQQRVSLDHYPVELAQSYGEPQQVSFVIPAHNQPDRILQRLQLDRTNNQCLEYSAGQQLDSKIKSSQTKSILPATILEEENEVNSQDSKLSDSDQCFVVIEHEGYRYQGHVSGGKKQGQGILTYPNGVYYRGEWCNDQMQGLGCLYYSSGRPYYEGQWKQGSFNGKGTFYNEEQQAIDGCFNYKDFNDIGKQWTTFEGNFLNDKKNGPGILTLANGQVLRAEWKDNVIEGRGSFHNLSQQVVTGIWIENVLYLEDPPR